MDGNSKEYHQMRDKALSQLRSGESLTGKDGAFAPLLKEFLEAALDGEMAAHLDEAERQQGNKRNGRGSKRVRTMAGEIQIETHEDRHSSFTPEILKKRETIFPQVIIQNCIVHQIRNSLKYIIADNFSINLHGFSVQFQSIYPKYDFHYSATLQKDDR